LSLGARPAAADAPLAEKYRDSSPISTTIHNKELISKQLGQISGATGRTRPVPIPLGRTHWSSTTSGTQDSVEIREESRNICSTVSWPRERRPLKAG
jgi:hypothetical protein